VEAVDEADGLDETSADALDEAEALAAGDEEVVEVVVEVE
jgi:hypothetical protein